MLKLSDDLSLPDSYVTSTGALLAVRGAGKSNTAAVIAEEMSRQKLPFVVFDPVGAWWGLRSGGDGKSAGLPVPIFGGRHGDVPLEPTAGELVADLVVDERLSAVLDLSQFNSEADKRRFLLAFAQRLYKRNEDPLHLFLEEADDYMPQKPMREQLAILGAFENIVRRGRSRGLGCTFITQRSAVLNKNVLTQTETLFAMRNTSPQDIKAIAEWVKYHDVAQDMLPTLSSLEDGEAWVWSPHVLKIVKRTKVRRRWTFDSGATPKNVKAGAHRPVATMADIDLKAIATRMAATIEKQRAEDPRELLKKIAALEGQLKKAGADLMSAKSVSAPPKVVEKLVITSAQIKEAEALIANAGAMLERAAESFAKPLAAMREQFAAMAKAFTLVRQPQLPMAPAPRADRAAFSGFVKEQLHKVASGVGVPYEELTKPAGPGDPSIGKSGLRRMLIALAQRPQGLTRGQLGLRARVSSKGGSFDTYLSKARVNGWIDSAGDRIRITEGGLTALGSYEALPEGQALLDHYIAEFGSSGAARMLRALADAYPRPLSRADLAEASNVSAAGGSFDTYLSKLRTLELIEGKGELRASDEFFTA